MLSDEIVSVFWRKLTAVDFFNIERSSSAGPVSGGGQLYIDIPLGRGISSDAFGRFFSGMPLSEDSTEWQTFEIDMHSAYEPEVVARVDIAPRNRRYRIANQNRQRRNSARHPAWSSEQGFPTAPDDIASRSDPRMPNLEYLKVCIGRTELQEFYAFFTNTGDIPSGWPKGIGLEILFQPNDAVRADGIIELSGNFTVERIAGGGGVTDSEQEEPSGDPIPVATIVRRSLTPRTVSTRMTTAPGDLRNNTGELAEAITVRAPRARQAEDWVGKRLNQEFGESRVVRYGHTNLESVPLDDDLLPGADFVVLEPSGGMPARFVEVKSAEDSLPRSIRLTAAELQRARKCAEDGVPYEIWIILFDGEAEKLVVVPNFQQRAVQLTIEDLVSIEVQLEPSE